MKVHGDYDKGYALIEGLIPIELCKVFLNRIKADMKGANMPLSRFAVENSPILNKVAIEIPGKTYRPMVQFLWGLTPAMSQLTGKDLLPTYNYFRIYREGDVCKVHSDREACEHSLSLTLAYSDGKTWDLAVGQERVKGFGPIREDFEDKDFSSLTMQPGDAVLYQGIHYRHGRLTPNPNRWSAHLFLHWIDKDGPYKAFAFDKTEIVPQQVEFDLDA
jgi:hypothetical protein